MMMTMKNEKMEIFKKNLEVQGFSLEFIQRALNYFDELEGEIESLKRQMQVAAIFAASQPHCPDGKDCDGYSTSEQSCTACWLEYWRQKSGTFQSGNNHKEASK